MITVGRRREKKTLIFKDFLRPGKLEKVRNRQPSFWCDQINFVKVELTSFISGFQKY